MQEELSTKAETEAWKQAEVKRINKHLESHREAGKGRREKKKRKAEYSNSERSGRKKAVKKGEMLKRRKLKGCRSQASTCGTAVGAKHGRMKGN